MGINFVVDGLFLATMTRGGRSGQPGTFYSCHCNFMYVDHIDDSHLS